MPGQLKRQTYYIKGMHCASCELVIEKKVLEFPGVEFADASLARGEVTFDYRSERPSAQRLSEVFKPSGYVFSEQAIDRRKEAVGEENNNTPSVLALSLTIILGFILLEKFGLSSLVNLTAGSAWPTFLVFGIIAGLSSCAALVGGLILSLSKQWQEQYGGKSSQAAWEPNLLFNAGRIISYALLGFALGLVGQTMQLSSAINSILLVAVSILMAGLALQMMGFEYFKKLRISLPKSLTRKIATGSSRQSKIMPFVFGFLTFLLPCGFTLMMEGVVVLSGSPVRGAIMMTAFAFGTAIPLLAIGASSAKLLASEVRADKFLKVAGILVLFFVFYNLNVQFRFVDWNKLTSVALTGVVSSEQNAGNLLPANNLTTTTSLSGETQIIKAIYTLRGDIQPNTFTVKKGLPVSFQVEVRDNGQGCMGTIMIPGLYNQAIYLQAGQTITMNFTPTQAGNYQITCAMGVPRGTLKVTD